MNLGPSPFFVSEKVRKNKIVIHFFRIIAGYAAKFKETFDLRLKISSQKGKA